MGRGKEMKRINDEEIQQWIDKCPEHDHELLHSDADGIVLCIRFPNEPDEEEKLDEKN